MELTKQDRREALAIATEFGLPAQSDADLSSARTKYDRVVEQLAALRQEAADEAVRRNRERFGEFWSTATVLERTTITSRQSLSNRVRRGTILRVVTVDGRNAYPSFQFEDGEVVPALRPILQVLLGSPATPMTVARWLTKAHAALDGRKPIDAVREDVGTVLRYASQEAAAWRE